MVEVDPIVLVAGGSLIGGIVIAIVLSAVSNIKMEAAAAANAAAAAAAAANAPNGKSKKKSKKGKSGNSSSSEINLDEKMPVEIVKPASKPKPKAAAAVPVPPPVVEPEEESEEEEEEEVVEPVAPAPAPAPAPVPVEVAPKKERKEKKKKEKKTEDPAPEPVMVPAPKSSPPPAPGLTKSAVPPMLQPVSKINTSSEVEQVDGWAVVDKRKGKKADEDGASIAESSSASNVIPPPTKVEELVSEVEEIAKPAVVEDFVSQEISVESRKIGLLIGPKGVTKIGIQNQTGADIQMPKDRDGSSHATVTVTGTANAVRDAVKAVNELCTKGYATCLAPVDFIEGQVTVHPKFLSDIIGPKGACIKQIQLATGVKITTPAANAPKVNGAGQPLTKVKIGLAGLRDQVSIARNTILEICKYYHTELSHPGVIHEEMSVSESYYNYIIGSKGSEIKHIQANYKVTVHIPNDESFIQNVLVVGEPQNVTSAVRHIQRLIEKVDNLALERRAAEAAELAKWGPGATAPPKARKEPEPEPVSPEDAWMKEFERPKGASGISMNALLPSTFQGPPTNEETTVIIGAAPASDGSGKPEDSEANPSISSTPAAEPTPSGSWGQPINSSTW